MKVNGASMHARRSENSLPPTASTVVLVHGLSVSSGYMVPTAVRLAQYHHVYLPDLPGFGKSAKPSHILTIPELADALADWMQAMELFSLPMKSKHKAKEDVALCSSSRTSRRIQYRLLTWSRAEWCDVAATIPAPT